MQICHCKLIDTCRDDLRSGNLEKNYVDVAFGVLYIFCVITPCSSVKIMFRRNISPPSSGSKSKPNNKITCGRYQRADRTYRVHLQGRRVSHTRNQHETGRG
jgi:hypothetical protein